MRIQAIEIVYETLCCNIHVWSKLRVLRHAASKDVMTLKGT